MFTYTHMRERNSYTHEYVNGTWKRIVKDIFSAACQWSWSHNSTSTRFKEPSTMSCQSNNNIHVRINLYTVSVMCVKAKWAKVILFYYNIEKMCVCVLVCMYADVSSWRSNRRTYITSYTHTHLKREEPCTYASKRENVYKSACLQSMFTGLYIYKSACLQSISTGLYVYKSACL